MNNDKGRLNYGVGLDNSQLRVGVAESRRLLQGIGQTAVDEGARIDDSFKRIGRTVAGVFAVSQIKDFITHVATSVENSNSLKSLSKPCSALRVRQMF